jgi:hypothetical protein
VGAGAAGARAAPALAPPVLSARQGVAARLRPPRAHDAHQRRGAAAGACMRVCGGGRCFAVWDGARPPALTAPRLPFSPRCLFSQTRNSTKPSSNPRSCGRACR